MTRAGATLFSLALGFGCATSGSAWMNEPLTDPDDDSAPSRFEPPPEARASAAPAPAERYRTTVIGGEREPPKQRRERIAVLKQEGRVLGPFRNTYYDFPSESDFDGDATTLFGPDCSPIAEVPRGFHDAVCVQGSGLLARGQTVSFSRRDCECADICPRSGHRICFDALDTKRFPWGRGALGKAITPLLTIAVDDDVIPMETPVYIPEFDGAPADLGGSAVHDGCFIAQDRGSRVMGKHVDIFTGHETMTRLWNRLVPSNDGVTVILDSPRCARSASR